jgi:hypothetical protein
MGAGAPFSNQETVLAVVRDCPDCGGPQGSFSSLNDSVLEDIFEVATQLELV